MSDAPFEPTPSKTDRVYDLLRRRILEGAHQPGDRISMDALARELGISKVPIREAISRLEGQGLITSRQHAAPTVSAVDVSQLRGAYLARAEIEPLIARLAAENADPEGLRRLADVQQEMHDALERDDVEPLGDLNYRFHTELATMSGLPLLVQISEMLLLAVRRYRVVAPLGTQNWSDVVQEHDAIRAALEAGDPAAAGEAARRHATSQAGHERALDPP